MSKRKGGPRRKELAARVVAAVRDCADATEVVEAAAAVALGVNRTDLRLARLLREHGAMAAGELASAAHLSPAATTTAVGRLVGAGLATRAVDSTDRRRAVVELTTRAAQRLDDVDAPPAQRAHRHAAGFTRDELAVIERFLQAHAALSAGTAGEAPPR